MAVASGATHLAAGITAALAPGDSLFMLTVALVLLGVGSNFGLISGAALVVDSAPLADRAPGTQGAVGVFIAIAGASGGALSGMVVEASSYATLSLAGGFLAVLLLPAVAWYRAGRPRPA
jgi:predicted MFS family arabinose efflux permease